MPLPGLVDLVASDPTLRQVVYLANKVSDFDLTIPTPARPLALAALSRQAPLLVVASTYREAEALRDALASVLADDEVAYYPAWETLPHERLSPRSDTVGRRLAVLRRLAGLSDLGAPRIVVAPVRSLLQPQVGGLGQLAPVTIKVGDDWDLSDLTAALVAAAYTRVDLVERRGEFAVRGGILDVFPPAGDRPVRIDFFGNTVDVIHPFAVADQRSLPETVTQVLAAPCRELLLTDEVRARAASFAARGSQLPEALTEVFDRLANGQAVEGMESLAAALVDDLELLIDVLPVDTVVVLSDPEKVRARASELVATSQEFLAASWLATAVGGQAPIDLEPAAYRELAEVRARAIARGQSWWGFSAFRADDFTDVADGAAPTSAAGNSSKTTQTPDLGISAPLSNQRQAIWPVTEMETFRGDTEGALTAIEAATADGWSVVLVAEGKGTAKRLAELTHEAGLPVVIDNDQTPKPGQVSVVQAGLRHGFRAEAINLAVFTIGDLTGQREVDRASRKMPTKRKNAIDPLQLAAGDPVVHERHGVGRYVEMVHRQAGGATREYLVIEYASSKRGQPKDRLFVPMDQLHQITRYVGGEMPTLDRLGGADWAARKTRARKAVKEIAAELIKLYAARRATKGHEFGPDTPWQRELEDSFVYLETPDQLAAINETKRDMEQAYPMDRLICGDVGYGKTEIAVRAAFKAALDGKQVAVLVPTTLLVTQHTNTFVDRFAGFPLKVAALSRFQTAKEAKAVLDGLADGTVDVVVGTHRLLSKEVAFKDLGLVIIDEEQRFGVEHKETLKQLRVNVDVLAMSATPIPRTLEMAVTGIREMSVIQTPPEERHPVLTFTGPYDEKQVRAAIHRELAREGQVFFIHNRTNTINKAAARLAELVPEARIAVAHGQMGEKTLEQVMLDFWEKRVDVLVCTTIVEAGLDISSANTLLIERADLLGLSQLHQLRGRVGRSRERGYAYFLYPPDKPLTQTAHDRLATMSSHVELGAGMAIALKDLEIRGAGNLLGGEQSGHIADVGFDLYLRLVGEAIANFNGDGQPEEPDMKIELPIDAHLPVDYVESERLRLEMYKRLARVANREDIEEVRAELSDRYGRLPGSAELLLEVAALRLQCLAAGVIELLAAGSNIKVAPVTLPESKQLRLNRLYPGAKYRVAGEFVLVPRPMTAPVAGRPVIDGELIDWAKQLIAALFDVPEI